MDTVVYSFRLPPSFSIDILSALLSQFPFYSLEESESDVKAYIALTDENEGLQNDLDRFSNQFDLQYTRTIIPYQRWNKIWEENFSPILVDQFCGIRAPFHHPLEQVTYELILQPKMAFGTGHHATTWMMIKQMQQLSFTETKVLDFGCGTGILAILAAKLGAQSVYAIDIEEEAISNSAENFALNHTTNIELAKGELQEVISLSFDIILANINRHVILTKLPTLYELLRSRGSLLVSGILQEDADLVLNKATKLGFSKQVLLKRRDWISILFTKTSVL